MFRLTLIVGIDLKQSLEGTSKLPTLRRLGRAGLMMWVVFVVFLLIVLLLMVLLLMVLMMVLWLLLLLGCEARKVAAPMLPPSGA